MAGRPRKMAKRITELEEKLEAVCDELDELTPEQNVKESAVRDPLALSGPPRVWYV